MNYPNPEKPHIKKILKRIRRTFLPGISPVLKAGKYYLIVGGEDCDGPYYNKMFNDGGGHKTDLCFIAEEFYDAGLNAMCVNLNDIVTLNMHPEEVAVHLILPEENYNVVEEVVAGIVEVCRQHHIRYTGGETSFKKRCPSPEIIPTISASAYKDDLIGKKIANNIVYPVEKGDELVGIASTGIHSNGLTLAWDLFEKDLGDYLDELVKPTEDYLWLLYPNVTMDHKKHIHGMIHVSGSTFRSLRSLSKKVDYRLTWNDDLEPQDIFKEMHKRLNKNSKEMYGNVNCGTGFVIIVEKGFGDTIVNAIKGTKSGVIGKVVKGSGRIRIKDQFGSGKTIVL